MVVGIIVALVVLLLLSAYFSATETAFTSFSAVRMKVLAEKKKSAKLVLKLADNYNRVLSTLLIGNNIVNIAAASPLLFSRAGSVRTSAQPFPRWL